MPATRTLFIRLLELRVNTPSWRDLLQLHMPVVRTIKLSNANIPQSSTNILHKTESILGSRFTKRRTEMKAKIVQIVEAQKFVGWNKIQWSPKSGRPLSGKERLIGNLVLNVKPLWTCACLCYALGVCVHPLCTQNCKTGNLSYTSYHIKPSLGLIRS